MVPGAGARSAAATRLSDAREGWSRVALWASELQPDKVGGACTVAPHDRCLNTNNREITIVVRGQKEEEGALVAGLGRGDALRCSWRSRCLRAGVSRNMIHGNGKGLIKCFFPSLMVTEEEELRRSTPSFPPSSPPSTTTQTKVKSASPLNNCLRRKGGFPQLLPWIGARVSS